MRDILPDRKITGSFQLTPTQAYEEANNGNRSRVHWDMVSIQRREYGGGGVCFDCKLIHRNPFLRLSCVRAKLSYTFNVTLGSVVPSKFSCIVIMSTLSLSSKFAI